MTAFGLGLSFALSALLAIATAWLGSYLIAAIEEDRARIARLEVEVADLREIIRQAVDP